MPDINSFEEARAQLDATPEKNGGDWRLLLAVKGDRIIGDERNVVLALRHAPELAGLVRFNDFALRLEFSRAPPWRGASDGDVWRDDDDTALMTWLQHHDIPVRASGIVSNTVALVAQDQPHHPVRAYLETLK